MKKYILFLFAAFFLAFSFTLFNINVHPVNASHPDNGFPGCAISSTLRVGSRGDQVICLQASLGLKADGKFGPKTKVAVMNWQKTKGLKADGVFGAKSRAIWLAGQNPSPSSVVISGVSGPQSLNVNQTGNWTVTAYDKNGGINSGGLGALSYSVYWGDEDYVYPMPMTEGTHLPMQQSATFTHSYSQARTYRPTFTVANSILCVSFPCPNSSASTSLSVNVGGGSTTVNNLRINPPVATIGAGATTTFSALLGVYCPTPQSCSEHYSPPPVKATWTSNNTNVATVQYKNNCPPGAACLVATDYLTAVVTGVSAGSATITATYIDSSGNVLTATSLITVTNSPTIFSLSPTSGVVGSQMTIYGNNFTSSSNRIKFGDTNSENDPSYNLNSSEICPSSYGASAPCTKIITFTIPSTYYVACHYSRPACEVMTRMVQPGVYPVSVINANGTSNAVNFTVSP